MNGRVVALQVAVGDTVAAGQPLLALEAMKMEHVHTAPCAGRVAALHVSLGEQVVAHRVVVEIEPALSAAALLAAELPAAELPAAELPPATGSAAG